MIFKIELFHLNNKCKCNHIFIAFNMVQTILETLFANYHDSFRIVISYSAFKIKPILRKNLNPTTPKKEKKEKNLNITKHELKGLKFYFDFPLLLSIINVVRYIKFPYAFMCICFSHPHLVNGFFF